MTGQAGSAGDTAGQVGVAGTKMMRQLVENGRNRMNE